MPTLASPHGQIPKPTDASVGMAPRRTDAVTATWLKQHGKHACIVGGASLTVQLLYLVEGAGDPTFAVPIVDAGTYHRMAARFAAGGALSDTAFYQPPLFPLLLGLFYRLIGTHLFAARMLLACTGALSCLTLWSIGRRVFSARTGLIAGLMLAVYGPFVFFNARLLPTGPAVLLDLLALRILIAAIASPRWSSWLGFGMLAGISTITVPNGAVVVVLAAAWLVQSALRCRRGWPAFVGIACSLVGAAGVIGVVTAHNYAKSGEWVIVSYNGGINFYIGNNPDADRTVAIRPGPRWSQFTRTSVAAGARTPAAQNAYFLGKAFDYLRDQPVDSLSGLARKTLRIFSAREIPRNVDVYVHRDFSRLLSCLVWRGGPLAFPLGVVAPLAAIGLVVSGSMTQKGEKRPRLWLLPAGFAGLYAASVVLFFVSARHRLPIVPVVVLFAAVGGIWAWGQIVGPHRAYCSTRLRITAVAVFAVTAAVVNLPIRAATDSINFRAELYNNVGAALAEGGEPDLGEWYVRHALRLNEGYAAGHSRLGLLLAQRGALREAEGCFRRSIALDANLSEVHWYLGNALLLQGRLDEATDAIETSLTIDPYAPEAHAVLGDVLRKRGRHAEAVEHYRSALELPPRRGELLFSLARALVQDGQYGEAIKRYRQGLDEVGPQPAALRDLARLLATCPQTKLRNCSAAIELAERLCRITGGRDPIALETLGVALAACARPAEAGAALTRAIDLAVAVGDQALADALRAVLTSLATKTPPTPP